ncbi:hypothetical protein LTR05_002896 [Lithohypha guttulata]|uniref:Uncharacterized protein n=1 Tax=Lithohypha guttulata TaxID=1690604 RepID=A0AAN7T300_9EURO|nr:hypothetical protein LTR05_002896 [Lithohypha guttulata]
MTLAHSFIRRGVNLVQRYSTMRQADDTPEVHQIPPFAALIFLLTCAFFFVLLAVLSYTAGHLILTLCMVESSSTTAYVPIESVEPVDDSPPAYQEDGSLRQDDADVNLIKTQPITASLKETARHLRVRAGYLWVFRGFSAYVVWNFTRSIVVGMLSSASNSPFLTIIAAIIAEVALANIHMTWIHIIISEPSPKRWYQRIPTPYLRTWKKIAPAVAIWAVTSQVVTILPLLVTNSFGVLRHMNDPSYQPGMKEAYAGAGQLFFAMLLTVLLFVLLDVPATVAMVRVAASMLPEEDETIVPFDRTFGGLTTPEIIGGQGKIGIVEAWRSFNWECRRRLLKTVVKVAALIMATWLLFSIVAMIEAHTLFGPAFGEMMKSMHGIANRGS